MSRNLIGWSGMASLHIVHSFLWKHELDEMDEKKHNTKYLSCHMPLLCTGVAVITALLSPTQKMFLQWKAGLQSRQRCYTGQPEGSEPGSSQGNSNPSCPSWYQLSGWVFHLACLFLPLQFWEWRWFGMLRPELCFCFVLFCFNEDNSKGKLQTFCGRLAKHQCARINTHTKRVLMRNT